MKYLRKNYHFRKIDSTSAYLLRRRFVLRNFSTVYADYQTAGKGRENRVWESQEKTNLLFSMLITNRKLCNDFKYISLVSAVSVIKLLNKLGITAKIKWPNDVYVFGKKVCGILLQSVSDENGINFLVIGVGINVNQKEFSKDLLREPTSISLLLNKDFSINKIKNLFTKILKKELIKVKDNDYSFVDFAKNNDYLKGQTVVADVKGEQKTVTVIGINSDCSLRVDICEKTVDLFTGEITFHIN